MQHAKEIRRGTDRAISALENRYEVNFNNQEEAEQGMRGILTDLRHISDIYALDFSQLDKTAHNAYLEEAKELRANPETPGPL